MKSLKIKSGWLPESGLRMDASYHLGDGPISKVKLKKSPFKLTSLEAASDDIFKGNIFKRCYVNSPEKGYPFLSPSDMMKVDINSGKYVSKKYTVTANLLLKKGWILVSRSGTLGNVVFTNDEFEGMVGSDDLIRIIPNNKNVLSGYLYAYLASKYGYALLTQSSYGGVVKHIEPHHIKDLLIPILPAEKQKKIHDLILEAAALRVEANGYLKEGVEYFEHKYKIDGLTPQFKKSVTNLNFSWASYNNNIECDKIYEALENSMCIRDVTSKCFAPPLFKHIYLVNDNGHPFLTGSELNKFSKKYYRWLSPRGVKNIQDYKITKGTLLLYKSGTIDGGILGNVFIADDILDGACLSDHVIRIFTEDIKMAYWIFAFLKSSSGIRLLQRTSTGSMIPFITPERLLDIKIPSPDKKFSFIADKIESYVSKSALSQLNENQAIDLIEKEIESWQE